jgi:hypothetical protein
VDASGLSGPAWMLKLTGFQSQKLGFWLKFYRKLVNFEGGGRWRRGGDAGERPAVAGGRIPFV